MPQLQGGERRRRPRIVAGFDRLKERTVSSRRAAADHLLGFAAEIHDIVGACVVEAVEDVRDQLGDVDACVSA